MLVNSKDWRSLAYLTGLPILVVVQWQQNTFNILLYLITLVLAIGVSSINHNHGHVPFWKNYTLNKITDYWICLVQGCPVFLLEAAHINSHHKYNQSQEDVTRVSRVGLHNHLLGYILFPIYVLTPINELKRGFLKKIRKENFAQYIFILGQHFALIFLWGIVFFVDWQKALIYVVLPQFVAVHFLLASNYLQHAQAQPGTEFNHSRNFTGFMNKLFFNVGYHTAHHRWEKLHWSELPLAHKNIANKIDPSLNEKSLIIYFLNTMTFTPLKVHIKSKYIKD